MENQPKFSLNRKPSRKPKTVALQLTCRERAQKLIFEKREIKRKTFRKKGNRPKTEGAYHTLPETHSLNEKPRYVWHKCLLKNHRIIWIRKCHFNPRKRHERRASRFTHIIICDFEITENDRATKNPSKYFPNWPNKQFA